MAAELVLWVILAFGIVLVGVGLARYRIGDRTRSIGRYIYARAAGVPYQVGSDISGSYARLRGAHEDYLDMRSARQVIPEAEKAYRRGDITKEDLYKIEKEANSIIKEIAPGYQERVRGMQEGLHTTLSKVTISGESSGGVYGELKNLYSTFLEPSFQSLGESIESLGELITGFINRRIRRRATGVV